jgi:hypothetical protein
VVFNQYFNSGTNDEVFRQTHYYISDDKKHDSLFVQHCMMLHWQWMCVAGISPTEHWDYSDGCAGQFKGTTAMYFVARYPGLTGGCKIRWNFFALAMVKVIIFYHQVQQLY